MRNKTKTERVGKKREHNKLWQERTDCRQTKLIFPQVEHKWRRKILNYKTEEIRILTHSDRTRKPKKTQIYNGHGRQSAMC